MAKYLDSNGVAHLWERVKSYVSANSSSIGAGEVSFDKLENPMRQNDNFTWDGNSLEINVDNASVLLPETNFKGQATFENVCEINGPAIFNGPARPKFNTRPVFSEPLDSGALGDGTVTMDKLAQDVKDAMGGSGGSPLDAYPVGAIYLSMSATSPQALFGGTWAKLEGRFLMCSDSSHAAGTTGGSNDAVVVSHTHSGESDTDGSHTHSISGGSHSHSGSTSSAGSHSHTTGIGSQSFVTSSGSFGYGSGGSTAPAPSSKTSATASSGSHSHSVTVNTSSSHTHTMTSAGGHYHVLTIDSAGQSGTNKNMPKYITVNAWQRTA